MGCVASKKAACPTPAVDSSREFVVVDASSVAGGCGGGSILSNSLWARSREEEDASESGGGDSASLEKVCSSKSTSTRSFRLGNLHNYIEGEQVAAGWPAWLSAVAKEAIQGWVPLRAESYEKLEKIGQGTYSSVFKARDLDTGKIVALKKVRFHNFEPESVRFMAREIMILRKLDHPNIMKLEGLITSRLSSSIYLVFEYMEHDLSGLSSCPNIRFTESQVKCYMHQLLSGLEHCHSRGIMHRDIKCANLLVNNEGVLKMADFGLANFFNPVHKQRLTSRVVTLWYRPPELLMGSTDYKATVDLWSVGCVFAEMFLKKPILQGRTEVEQIHKVFKLCGSPPEEYWKKTKIPHATLFKPQQPYENCLRETLKSLPESTFNLLETFLSVEPYKRGTASIALASEYFKTKPYACEPSSLPKYPPNKEIDAKNREDIHRKRITGRGREPEATRPSRVTRVNQPNGPSKLATRPEDSRIRNHGPNKICIKQDLTKLNGDTRLIVDLQPMPAINPLDETQQLKHLSRETAHPSGHLHVSASRSFAWEKRLKDDRPYVRTNSRSRSSGVLEPSNVLQAKNNNDLKGHANGAHDTRFDPKGNKSCEMSNHTVPKQRGKLEHLVSFNALNYRPQNLSEAFYKRDAVSPKHDDLGSQGKGERVEFSGPLLSQTQKVDELLERHERQIRQAVRRSWFQRGKK